MSSLFLKPTYKSVNSYYVAFDQFTRLGVTHETAVRAASQSILEHRVRQCWWTQMPEYGVRTGRGRRIVVDGAQVDDFRLSHGYREAKGDHDDLPAEIGHEYALGAIIHDRTQRKKGAT